ncbi:MAG: cbb3-type cytochrome c oxidase subunit 3 [Oceanicaulis sp.]
MYDPLSNFAQTWGMIIFIVLFAAAAVYAFWPKNQDKFDEAARIPLEDADSPAAAEERAADDRDPGEDKDRSHD